jgi:hypothetical protein
MSVKTGMSTFKALAASALFLIAVGVAPAAAEVLSRGGAPASSTDYAPAIAVPEGWVHDSAFEDGHMQILVPAGKSFINTDRVIMAAALRKAANQTIADMMRSSETGGTLHFAGISFIHLPDLSRGNGKEPFHLVLTQKPDSTKFELSAVTVDTDQDGNAYFVTIWLSTDEVETLNAAVPLYENVLRAY